MYEAEEHPPPERLRICDDFGISPLCLLDHMYYNVMYMYVVEL